MTELEQRLAGENKVLRDLLKQASGVLHVVLDNDMESSETEQLEALVSQIDGALSGAPADLLGVV